jgi:hypothetical protein
MVKERNANYEQIVKQLTFRRKPWFAVAGSEEELDDDSQDSLPQSAKKRLPVLEQPGLNDGRWRRRG